MIHIDIDEEITLALDVDRLETAAQETILHEHAPDEADVTILLTGDERIRQLNRQFLDLDEPTDVLSFPADFIDPDTTHTYLGDVVISVPRAEAQAKAGGHALVDELNLLVVHGMLHLFGYDHETPEDKDEMWAAQAKVLEKIGCPLSPP